MYITKDNKKETLFFLSVIMIIYFMILYNMLSFSSIYSNLIEGQILYLTIEYALICILTLYLLYHKRFNAIFFWGVGTLSFIPLIYKNEFFYIIINWVVTVHLALFAKLLYEWYQDYNKGTKLSLSHLLHNEINPKLFCDFNVEEVNDRIYFKSKDLKMNLSFYIEDIGSGDIGIRDIGYTSSYYNLDYLEPVDKILKISTENKKSKAVFSILPLENREDKNEFVFISSKADINTLIENYITIMMKFQNHDYKEFLTEIHNVF